LHIVEKGGNTPFRFEGLEIWHTLALAGSARGAREFSARIHEVTVKFARQDQTNALFSHQPGLAVGETFEVVSGSFPALDRKYITPEKQAEVYIWGDALGRKLIAFRNILK
jgi:hypothetical protein